MNNLAKSKKRGGEKGEPLLFLTASVNVGGALHVSDELQQTEVRIQQYLQAIRIQLENTTFRILLVENTGYDFSKHFTAEIASGRMEVLTFYGNERAGDLGRGYGEMVILKYGFEHSQFVKECNTVIKVTGRHVVHNTQQLYRLIKLFRHKRDFVAANLQGYTHWATSDLFVASKSFYENHLFPLTPQLKDWVYNYENALYDAMCSSARAGFQTIQLPYCIKQSGSWGGNGNDLSKMILSSHRFGVKCFIVSVLNELHLRKIF